MRVNWILLALAAATLIFLMILRPGGTPDQQATEFADDSADSERQASSVPADSGEVRERRAPEATADAGEAVVDPQPEAERPSGGYDSIGRLFHASDDYHALTEDMIDAAQEGDAAAQYYLSRVLSQCRLAVSQFDGEFPDEQQMAMATPGELNPEINDLMMEQVGRCRGFFDDEPDHYGDADGWLEEAAKQGYGPAVMQQGIRQYQHWRVGRDSDFDPAQVVDTLRKRNPDTLASASQLSALGGSPQEDEMAWLMLACEYGQDCSADADWVKALCLQEGCPPGFQGAEDALSLLMTPGELERARDRMDELEQALDAGDFESLFP
ncbi:TPR repeat protein [Natronospira proteinivora]|uniref:TPR repeat protein n=1 Tax=Natronospira proteinivora TaxID=1807133 RepID=A0ABT1GB81_9GAMM|nr:hypothetical protein [Natronospira proteinivora]MCP1728170.1 TPR repeat protein [Natronospira proteinivora]